MALKAERAAPGADRRQFPRVDLNTSVEVQGPQGARWVLVTADISRRGLQARCGRDAALEVVRSCRGATTDGDALLVVRLQLGPPGGLSRPFAAACRLVYARSVSAEEFALGLEYASFEGASHEVLQRFILDCLRY